MTNLSNVTPIETILAAVRKLGHAEGVGAMSRSKLALLCAERAREGAIDERNVPEIYAEYLTGVNSSALVKGQPRADASLADASTRVQESKLRQIVKLGQLPLLSDDFDTAAMLLKHATEIAATLRGNEDGAKVKSPYDAMVDVARAQLEKPETKLTDAELTAIVSKPEKKQKDEIEKLAAAYKAAHKLHSDLKLPGTEAAVQAYRDAILEAGGDVPPMTKEEKEAAAAMAFLAKRGMVASPALCAPV